MRTLLKKQTLAGITVTAIFLLGGCSGTGDTASTADAKICNLIADTEMHSLMESDFSKLPLEALPRGSEGCKYVAEEGERNINYIIGTSEKPEQSKEAYDKAVSVWRNSSMPNRTYSDVTEVGTDAFWAYGATIPQLIVYKDKQLLIITLGHFETDSDTTLYKAKRIAKLLLGEISGTVSPLEQETLESVESP